MRNFDEPLARLAANSLRRRIRRDQLGMRRFKLLQFVDQAVKFRIADLGIIEHVIAVLMTSNLVAQRFNFVFNMLNGFHRTIVSPPRHGSTENTIHKTLLTMPFLYGNIEIDE